jgi:hypothetical protein
MIGGLLCLGPTPALADGSIVKTAVRLGQETGKAAQARPAPARASTNAQGNVASSGLSRGKKILVALADGLGVAGAMWAIDHGVEDVTPSSRGLRKD